MNEKDKLLMIFIRNAQIGRVKTRLAATVGDERALEIYIHLLEHTAETARNCKADKAVFYSEYIEEADEFEVPVFQKYLQTGRDLGEKMKQAFVKGFGKHYSNVVIIGSDCMELTTAILDEAFLLLQDHDIVIGPAKDGGYYLLGMKKIHHAFFENKSWSTSNVLLDTLLDCQKEQLRYALLPPLNDVDEYGDLNEELRNMIS